MEPDAARSDQLQPAQPLHRRDPGGPAGRPLRRHPAARQLVATRHQRLGRQSAGQRAQRVQPTQRDGAGGAGASPAAIPPATTTARRKAASRGGRRPAAGWPPGWASRSRPPSTDLGYGVGDDVLHDRFGAGVVQDVRPDGDDWEVTVHSSPTSARKLSSPASPTSAASAPRGLELPRVFTAGGRAPLLCSPPWISSNIRASSSSRATACRYPTAKSPSASTKQWPPRSAWARR